MFNNIYFNMLAPVSGASDDMVSCAIMMETLRALSHADVPLKHAIVFNFNGAEEAILQVCH